MDFLRGGLKISDEDITRAVHFDGYGPEYLNWPDHLWKDRPNGIPDHDIGHNAWHIKRLAEAMRRAGQWVGEPLQLYDCGKCVREGNHRYRAVQYLRDVLQITIRPEVCPTPYSGCRTYCKR